MGLIRGGAFIVSPPPSSRPCFWKSRLTPSRNKPRYLVLLLLLLLLGSSPTAAPDVADKHVAVWLSRPECVVAARRQQLAGFRLLLVGAVRLLGSVAVVVFAAASNTVDVFRFIFFVVGLSDRFFDCGGTKESKGLVAVVNPLFDGHLMAEFAHFFTTVYITCGSVVAIKDSAS